MSSKNMPVKIGIAAALWGVVLLCYGLNVISIASAALFAGSFFSARGSYRHTRLVAGILYVAAVSPLAFVVFVYLRLQFAFSQE